MGNKNMLGNLGDGAKSDPSKFEASGSARQVLEAEASNPQAPRIHSFELGEDGNLHIIIPIDAENKPSHLAKSGKSFILTSSRGNQVVNIPGYGSVQVSMNVFIPVTSNGS